MDHIGWATYFLALAALTAAPGPIMALVIARSALGHRRDALAFVLGLCIGDLVAVCVVISGIGIWTDAGSEWLGALKYVGVAYLLWVAFGIWHSRIGEARTRPRGWLASVGAGAALCLGNPSTFLIYLLLVPSIAPNGVADMGHAGLVVGVTFAAVGGVLFGVLFLAQQLTRLASPGSSVLLSRIMAVTIGVLSLWMAVG